MNVDYFLQPPNQQIFYRVLIFSLALCGLGNSNWWNINFHKYIENMLWFHGWICRIAAPTSIVLMIIYMTVNYNKMTAITFGITFSVLPVGFNVHMKQISVLFMPYKKIMKDFMNKIHVFNCYIKDKDDDFIKEKLIRVEKYIRVTSYYVAFLLAIGWFSWMVVPIVNNYINREYVQNRTMRLQTCIYLWTPFDYDHDFGNWAIMHIISSYLSGVACSMVCTFDLVMFSFVFNMLGHIEIFKHLMKTKFLDKDITEEETKMRLVEVIKYHTFLVETFQDMQSGFGLNVTMLYLQNLFEDSLLLYELMLGEKGEKIPFGIMLLIYMGELILMSFTLEEIRRQSDDLSELLYCIPWEDMSLSNQRTFKILLLNMQPILSFKGAGGLQAGVNPMISIMKSTFSYYVMLKSSIQRSK